MKGTQLETKKDIEVLDLVSAFKEFVILDNRCFLHKILQRSSNSQPESNEAVYKVQTLEPHCWV